MVGAASGFALSHGDLKGAVSGAIGAAGAEMVAEALPVKFCSVSSPGSAYNPEVFYSGKGMS